LSQVDTEGSEVVEKGRKFWRDAIAPTPREGCRDVCEGMAPTAVLKTRTRKARDLQTEDGEKKE
tara:strand:+ start:2025 stop:2216 length:192 start_codon:yes stop_codon:yes gene_type:complete